MSQLKHLEWIDGRWQEAEWYNGAWVPVGAIARENERKLTEYRGDPFITPGMVPPSIYIPE